MTFKTGRFAKMKESIGLQHDSHLFVLYHDNTKDKCLAELEKMTNLFRNVTENFIFQDL